MTRSGIRQALAPMETRAVREHGNLILAVVLLFAAAMLPFFYPQTSGFIDAVTLPATAIQAIPEPASLERQRSPAG